MAFQIRYTRLFEVAFWHHAELRTNAYNPALFNFDTAGYDPNTSPFVIPLSTVVPPEVADRLLKFDLRRLLRIQPNPETSDLLAQLGLIFKTSTLGFTVVSDDSIPLPTDNSLRFTFEVAPIDPEFIAAVAIQPNWPNGQVFHMTNARQTPQTRFLLSASGSGEVLHQDHFFPRQGRVVRLPQLSPGTGTTLNIFNALADPAGLPVATLSLPAVNGQTEYELDLRFLREGRYRINGANITEVTHYLGLEKRPEVVGVLDIFPNNWEGTIYDIRLAEATA